MSRCRALTVATCLATLTYSAAALAQWPAPQQAQQAPAGAWPAPAPQQAAPSGAWPAPSGNSPSAAAPPPPPSQAPAGPAFMPPSAGFGPSLAAPPQQQQEPPCLKDFVKLRDDAGKKRSAIEAASKKKVPPTVACRLFNEYSASEVKLIKFVTANTDKCGMPKELLDNLSKGHAQTTQIRTRVCEVAAAGPPKPAGPRLSDVLGAPVPDSSNVKTGRGTFDTLSGSPLAR